ncbi:MAG: methionyl-tRNA formyltransferase [Polyangiaceae bacterium]
MAADRPRSVFFGTPAFSVPTLDALTELTEVVAVVCQPDRKVGRGLELTAPPVKARAQALGIEVHQPTKLRTGEFAEWLKHKNADLALVIAYGRILPPDVLAAPRLGCINVHASLLPKYRGAAPITWAVVRGEKKSGVTLMQMDAGMDTGAMLEQFSIDIGDDETAGELGERIAKIGADAARVGIPKVLAGTYSPRAQDEADVTLAPILKKEDGLIDWGRAVQAVHNHVRGMSPWPGAFTKLKGKIIKVHSTRIPGEITPNQGNSAPPGTVTFADKSRVLVACEGGVIELSRVQLEGKKAVTAVEWHLGRGVATGDLLGA